MLLMVALPLTLNATKSEDEQVERKCLLSLANFMQYARNIYHNAGENGEGMPTAYFRATSAGKSNEDGVRTNLDLVMVTAFLYRQNVERGEQGRVALPEALTDDDLLRMALPCLRYAYSTHHAVRLQRCEDGRYWGTWHEPKNGKTAWHHQWESSLWTLSLALAAHFLDSELDSLDRQHVRTVVTEEADYQLSRRVPTGWKGDTKAEENGWEANVLACAVALYPDHANHSRWSEALQRYAFNCYTVSADKSDSTMVSGRPACEWFEGQNLYDDFTLQNHDYFHTSYQNVVMQEQAECLIAMELLARGERRSALNALRGEGWQQSVFTWHWQEVWSQVLAWLALCDGELAMPNGNDWSMFLYDQLPAYAAMATLMKNGDALMLEKRCLEQLLQRQQTTADGSYLLNADIGPRRMGVTAHRVMMTYWLHRLFGTDEASTWEDFQQRHREARMFDSQRIVRAMSESRFACFSMSEGLKSCTGIIVPCVEKNSKIFIPYKEGFGGNLMGCPDTLPENVKMKTDGNQWVVWGQADGKPFAVWATPGNAVLVLGRGVTMAVSVDAFTSQQRQTLQGASWVCIDDGVAVVAPGAQGGFTLSAPKVVQSIGTSVLTAQTDSMKPAVIYYSNVNVADAEALAGKVKQRIRKNKMGRRSISVSFTDPDSQQYELVWEDSLQEPVCLLKQKRLLNPLKKRKR